MPNATSGKKKGFTKLDEDAHSVELARNNTCDDDAADPFDAYLHGPVPARAKISTEAGEEHEAEVGLPQASRPAPDGNVTVRFIGRTVAVLCGTALVFMSVFAVAFACGATL